MTRTLGWVLAIGLSIFMVAAIVGGPILSSDGLRWDNSSVLARIAAHERVELARIAAEEADSARWAETLRWVVAGVTIGVALYYARGVVWRWLDRRAQVEMLQLTTQAEVQLAALPILAQRPGSYLAQVDGGWFVVDDARRELVSVERRLTG